MAKSISEIKQELGITSSSTFDDLLNLANQYKVFSQAEINNIKAISVLPLPTNVKDRAEELKRRFTDIVLNENKGQVHSINIRFVIILELFDKFINEIETKFNNLYYTVTASDFTNLSSIEANLSSIEIGLYTFTPSTILENIITNFKRGIYVDWGTLVPALAGAFDRLCYVPTKIGTISDITYYYFSSVDSTLDATMVFYNENSQWKVRMIESNYIDRESFDAEVYRIDQALDTKQDNLTFDNSPTINSNNPVKSGGVYTALGTKADKADTYTKAEVNTALNLKADKNTTYTRTVINDMVTDLESRKADKSTTYTKTEIDNTMQEIMYAFGVVDNALNKLESVQNVVDVVATKSALNSYDTSKLEQNDKIQVIADETQSSASTIYNWNGSAWALVGAFGGNSYTKVETNALLDGKADKSTTYTKTEVDTALGLKANQSTTYTKTEVDTLLGAKANASTTYSKTETDSAIATAVSNCKNYTNSKINDLRWELGSHTLDVESDTDVAFSKSVPANTVGCKINKIGGMSYKSENLIVLTDVAETTRSGVKFKVENGIITINGTSTTSGNIFFPASQLVATLQATQYTFSLFSNTTDSNTKVFLGTNIGSFNTEPTFGSLACSSTRVNFTKTLTTGGTVDLLPFIANATVGATYDIVIKPMLVTGGTVPTTWKQGFTGIRDSAVISVVSKDSNSDTVATLNINSLIQSITGYGWGVNENCYNYIDYDRKVFVQKVGRVDLGTLTPIFISSSASSSGGLYFANYNITISNVNNILTTYNYTTDANSGWSSTTPILAPATVNQQIVLRYYTTKNTNAEIMAELNGVYLYYELATPIETDITNYIDEGYINVEANGTIEFTNTYNNFAINFNNDVPSDVDYLIEEVKA